MSRKTLALLPEHTGLDTRIVLIAENVATVRLEFLNGRSLVYADHVGGGSSCVGAWSSTGEPGDSSRDKAAAWLETLQGLLEDVLT